MDGGLDVMQNSRQLSISRAVAILLVVALFDSAGLLRMAVGPLLGVQTSAQLLVVLWSWLLLLLSTIGGLAAGRRWGAYLLICLVPVSTVFLSISFIPGVTSLVPAAYRPHALLLANTLVLLTAPLLLQRLPPPLRPTPLAG
jgi:hypothetical protein